MTSDVKFKRLRRPLSRGTLAVGNQFQRGEVPSRAFLLFITIRSWTLAGRPSGHAIRLRLERGPCPRTAPPLR